MLRFILICFCFTALFYNAQAQNTLSIHQLESPLLPTKTHDMVGNLRTHDAYSSAGNSIGGAIMGFIFGPILFFISFIFIWFNEKRAVIDYRRLNLASQICQQVNPLRRDQITGANEKLTHVSGNSTTNQAIGDRLSNISMNGAIKINRSVEVMEWRATNNSNNSNNGNRQVQYNLGWQSENIPSVEGRSNPQTNWFVKNQTIYNQKVFVGQYILLKSQQDKCVKANQINPDMNNGRQIAANTNRRVDPVIQDGYIYFPSPNSNSISDHGALRIKYSYCPVGPISIIAKTSTNTFTQFPIAQYQGKGKIQKNQLPACCLISNCIAQLLKPIEEIQLVEQANLSKDQMIEGAVSNSKIYTIIIRVVSYLMMVAGICLFFSPITTILGFIPLVGGILKGTVGFVILLAALLICIPLFIIAFSLAWLWYHPKVGLIFLAIGLAVLGLILFLNFRGGNGQQAAATMKHLLRAWNQN